MWSIKGAAAPVRVVKPARVVRWDFLLSLLSNVSGSSRPLGPKRPEELGLLRLDSVGVAEYVGFHGVCFPFDGWFELWFTT
jgi:hypothetical protein